MNELQRLKVVRAIPPQARVDNTSATTIAIDTLGYNSAFIAVQIGATDIAMTALKVQESDTLSGSDLENGADVTGLVYGTSNNIAGSASSLPSATDDDKIFGFQIDLRNRKRYLKLVATCGNGTAGTFISGLAILGDPDETVNTAAGAGCSQILRV